MFDSVEYGYITNVEIFKDIEGYGGKYQISNKGSVKNKIKGNILKPWKEGIGYYEVSLSYKGRRTKYKVHRLVAMYFIPNPKGNPIINHKDENKLNNNADNLDWSTYKLNNKEITDRNYKKVKCIETGEVFNSYALAQKWLGAKNSRGVYQACNGILKTYKGYRWQLIK